MTDFSIITVSKNSGPTIGDTIRSVLAQRGPSIEHIVKDAGSSDDTQRIVRDFGHKVRLLVCSDRGIYDGMNQGFLISSGRFIGFLNSDDTYADESVLAAVKQAFEDESVGIVYGDVKVVARNGGEFRSYVTGPIGDGLHGRQIPHPALFVRRSVLQRLPKPFDESYRISADFKQQLILVDQMKTRCAYVPQTLAVMRTGGESTRSMASLWRGWSECARACREVVGGSGWPYVARKVLLKIPQLRGLPT